MTGPRHAALVSRHLRSGCGCSDIRINAGIFCPRQMLATSPEAHAVLHKGSRRPSAAAELRRYAPGLALEYT